MTESVHVCAVCGGPDAQGTRMSKVVIDGRTLELCRAHAATVVAARPETFDDLRALFVGAALDESASPRAGSERRSPITRRDADDRRVFPPRPEGRRLYDGRRAGDGFK